MRSPRQAIEIDTVRPRRGPDVLNAVAGMALAATEQFAEPGGLRLGRLRGRGRDASFASLVRILDGSYGLEPRAPFEGSDRVGGAVYPLVQVGETPIGTTVLKWDFGAQNLPLHTHDASDRFIVVLEGRGFFHWALDASEPLTIRTVAARPRDVFAFSRGLRHTFSTFDSSMKLLSVHVPFIPFDDPGQYTLVSPRWTVEMDDGFITSHAAIDWLAWD